MTALLAPDPSYPLPDPVDMPVTGVGREFALGTPTRHSWNPAPDDLQDPMSPNNDNTFQQAPSAQVIFLDPARAYSRQLEVRLGDFQETVDAYDDRISVLDEQASIEGYPLNSQSKETFLEFFRNNPLTKLGRLILLENGNLRAVWKGDDASHVGLQFLDNGLIQYVLFKQRHADGPVSRAYGRDTPTGVLAQISALELDQVLYL